MDGTKDIPLLHYLAEEGYGYFITQDLKQMTILQEREALKTSGMSWIGVPHMERQVKGKQLVAAQVAVLAPVVGRLLKEPLSRPTAYYLHEARSTKDLIRCSEAI